ncbi:MAG: hypothetical protein ABI873_07270 [Marmoricola sp.]
MAGTIITWGRVEGHARTTDISVGLAAEVADPLWFLLRQWQLGELTGDDGGTPVAIDVATSWSRFSRIRPEGLAAEPGAVVALGSDHGPFERIVEREALLRPDEPGATPWVAAVHAGRSLRRQLLRHGLGDVADRLMAQLGPDTAFRPAAVAHTDEAPVEGPDDARYRALLAGKVLDGSRLLKMVLDDGSLPASVVGGAPAAELAAALQDWQDELAADWGVAESGTSLPDTWVRDRLEYAFSIAAPPLPVDPDVPGQSTSEVVLKAAQYDGTGLAWHSLDLDPDPAHTLGADQDTDAVLTGSRVNTVLASPLRYPGMPADRYWEFEDTRVSLGRASAGPTDLARMLAIDFALVYSPDWFLAPVELPVGCVGRIDWVIVRDTFGAATLVGTSQTQAGDGVGRQFQPSNVAGEEGDNPLLVVLPSALATMTSEAEEDVALQRDEVANVAWSIEKCVLGPSGRGVLRPWFRTEFDLPAATAPPADYELVWRLATPVARSWSPLVSILQADDAPKVLRKARLLETTTDAERSAKSQIMRDVDKDICDEEITRAGVQVRIVEQLARWHDGSSYVWRGREKRSWRGEAASGLRFDATTPQPRA